MKLRVISGIILSFTFLTFIIFSKIPLILSLGVGMLAALSVYEVISATKYIEGRSVMIVSILAALSMPFFAQISVSYLLGALYLYILMLFFCLIIFYKTFNFKHICVVMALTSVISCFFGVLVPLRAMEHGGFLLCLVFVVSWMSDAGGYIVGSLMGKHKMVPLISPKKTWEGAVGCILFSIIGVAICSIIFSLIFDVKYTWYTLIIVSVVGSVIAQIGDLTASAVKRTFGIKDFGNLIPGHGGIFDRFDSICFVAPALFLLFNALKVA